MSAPHFLGPLVVVFVAALVAGWLAHRLRQPPLIGFLVAGALIGPWGLGLVADPDAVETLAEVGVVLLLFTVGLELSLANLGRLGRMVWIAGPIQVFGTIVLTMLVALAARLPLPVAVFTGFFVSICSTAIVLKLLADRREIDTPHGRFLIGINIFGDLMVVPMMLVTPLLPGGIPAPGLAALVAVAKAVGTVALVFVAGKFVLPPALRALAGTRQKEMFVVAVLLLVGATAMVTSWAGLSVALGALLAGLILSDSDYGHQAMADIAPFRDAFNALFFVSVGMLLDVRAIGRSPTLVAALLGVIFVGKAAAGAAAPLAMGYGARVAAIVGLSVAQVGELAFVLLQQGRRAGLLSPERHQAFLAAAVISMIAAPFLIGRGHALGDWVSGRAGLLPPRRGGTRPAIPTAAAANPVVLLGFGHGGETLARVLKRASVPFRILELNPERVARGRSMSLPIEYGDAASDVVLRQLGMEQARAAVILLSDPRATQRAVRLCRALAPSAFLLVRTRYLSEVPELAALGADEVVAEEFETTLEMAGRLLRRLGFSLPWVESETDAIRGQRHDAYGRFRAPDAAAESLERALGGVRIEFVSVAPEWPAAGRSLRDLDLRRSGGAIVLAVVREGNATVAPEADFVLEGNDQVLLLGVESAIEATLGHLRGN